MIDGIEALTALERTGTISEAAAQLRLTQSAISKRIQSLQDQMGFRLIEPDGRRVRLTPQGLLFLQKAKPLIAELQSLGNLKMEQPSGHFTLAMADSIAASWGPRLIKKTLGKMPYLEIDLHVHRSVLVHDHVKFGRYQFGLCTSFAKDPDMISVVLLEEPLVLIHNKLKDRLDSSQRIVTIEKGSSTWKSIGAELTRNPRFKKSEFLHVESFSAAVQMAKEGFGNAIVPLGLAKAMHVPSSATQFLNPAIKRQIHLVYRKSMLSAPLVEGLQKCLQDLATELL